MLGNIVRSAIHPASTRVLGRRHVGHTGRNLGVRGRSHFVKMPNPICGIRQSQDYREFAEGIVRSLVEEKIQKEFPTDISWRMITIAKELPGVLFRLPASVVHLQTKIKELTPDDLTSENFPKRNNFILMEVNRWVGFRLNALIHERLTVLKTELGLFDVEGYHEAIPILDAQVDVVFAPPLLSIRRHPSSHEFEDQMGGFLVVATIDAQNKARREFYRVREEATLWERHLVQSLDQEAGIRLARLYRKTMGFLELAFDGILEEAGELAKARLETTDQPSKALFQPDPLLPQKMIPAHERESTSPVDPTTGDGSA